MARFADRAAVRWPAMRRVRKLVGSIRAEQLRSVDWALGRDVGVFIPMAGPCGYAITHGQPHPARSFILPLADPASLRTRLISGHRTAARSAKRATATLWRSGRVRVLAE